MSKLVRIPRDVARELRAAFTVDGQALARFLDERGLVATACWVRRNPDLPARAFSRGFRVVDERALAQPASSHPAVTPRLEELRRRFAKHEHKPE